MFPEDQQQQQQQPTPPMPDAQQAPPQAQAPQPGAPPAAPPQGAAPSLADLINLPSQNQQPAATSPFGSLASALMAASQPDANMAELQASIQQSRQRQKELADRYKESQDASAQLNQLIQQQMNTSALEKYLPKPSARQMLSDALTNFGMSRMTGGNFTPIQLKRYEEAFKSHQADLQNMTALYGAKKSESQNYVQLMNQERYNEANATKAAYEAENIKLKQSVFEHQLKPVPGTTVGADLVGALAQDATGQPINPTGHYHVMRNNAGDVVAAYPAQFSDRVSGGDWIKTPESATGFAHVLYGDGGKILKVYKDVTPPAAYLPTINKTQSMRFEPQPDGTIMAVPVESTTQRSKDTGPGVALPAGAVSPTVPALPGVGTPTPPTKTPVARPAPNRTGTPPAAPSKPPDISTAIASLYDSNGNLRLNTGSGPVKAGQIVGGRSLPPGARLAATKVQEALNNTTDLVTKVLPRIKEIGGMIDAGKISLAMQPNGIVALSRLTHLTPQEEELAGDMASLAEHINTLRGPLGATGFRGPEAFGALQAQKGNLLGRPGVVTETLMNTLKALQGQRKSYDMAFAREGGPGVKPTIDTRTAKIYLQLGGMDQARAKAMAAADGYKVD